MSGITSTTLQVLIDRLSNFAVNELLGLFFGVDDDIRKLERTLLRIQGLVDDIESQHLTSNNGAWQAWLQEVKTISFDADDLLDKIDLELMRLNSDNGSIHTKVREIVHDSFFFKIFKKERLIVLWLGRRPRPMGLVRLG